jgi:hypothetical protein
MSSGAIFDSSSNQSSSSATRREGTAARLGPWLRWLRHDRLLVIAVVICGLLIGYELGVTLLHPAWIGSATDWLRAALAWPELLVLVAVSYWFSRQYPAPAAATLMLSAAFLAYAVARTIWTVDDQLVYHHGVPFPILPDLFFVLQYPFFLLAFLLLPSIPSWT